MHFSLSSICTYLLLILPIPIATLVLQPRTNSSDTLVQTKLPGIASHGSGNGLHAPDPLANTWCRPPDSELDLQFSTFGGKPLDFQDVLWAVGVLREVISDEIKAHGRNGRCEEKSLRVVTRGIVLTIFDERLKEHTWGEVYDLLDVLLVCVYVDKIGSEMHGMFFQIANWHRVAAFMISSAAEPGPPAGGIATS